MLVRQLCWRASVPDAIGPLLWKLNQILSALVTVIVAEPFSHSDLPWLMTWLTTSLPVVAWVRVSAPEQLKFEPGVADRPGGRPGGEGDRDVVGVGRRLGDNAGPGAIERGRGFGLGRRR